MLPDSRRGGGDRGGKAGSLVSPAALSNVERPRNGSGPVARDRGETRV